MVFFFFDCDFFFDFFYDFVSLGDSNRRDTCKGGEVFQFGPKSKKRLKREPKKSFVLHSFFCKRKRNARARAGVASASRGACAIRIPAIMGRAHRSCRVVVARKKPRKNGGARVGTRGLDLT